MKSTSLNSIYRNVLLVLVSALLMSSIQSCAKKVSFVSSPIVPAAQGTVKIKKDKNKNYNIDIEIFNLAEPEKLQNPKLMYVVWMLTDQNITKNIGQIKTSSGMFSKSLKASFETVTSFKPVKIFVTGENDTDVQYPDYQVILTTDLIKN
jgi:hypothetical protein